MFSPFFLIEHYNAVLYIISAAVIVYFFIYCKVYYSAIYKIPYSVIKTQSLFVKSDVTSLYIEPAAIVLAKCCS